jgi:hypothetical protein
MIPFRAGSGLGRFAGLTHFGIGERDGEKPAGAPPRCDQEVVARDELEEAHPVIELFVLFAAASQFGGEGCQAEPAKTVVWPVAAREQASRGQSKQSRFQRAAFCLFSTSVVIATFARLALIDHFVRRADETSCRLLLEQGEVAVANRAEYQSSFVLVQNLARDEASFRLSSRRTDAKRILLFWQNGLYGLFTVSSVNEKLRHLAGLGPKWVGRYRDFCSGFDFDKCWFGHSTNLRKFRSHGIVPKEAVKHLDLLRSVFPRSPAVPTHSKVDWDLSELAKQENSKLSSALKQVCLLFPGPATFYQSEANEVVDMVDVVVAETQAISPHPHEVVDMVDVVENQNQDDDDILAKTSPSVCETSKIPKQNRRCRTRFLPIVFVPEKGSSFAVDSFWQSLSLFVLTQNQVGSVRYQLTLQACHVRKSRNCNVELCQSLANHFTVRER